MQSAWLHSKTFQTNSRSTGQNVVNFMFTPHCLQLRTQWKRENGETNHGSSKEVCLPQVRRCRRQWPNSELLRHWWQVKSNTSRLGLRTARVKNLKREASNSFWHNVAIQRAQVLHKESNKQSYIINYFRIGDKLRHPLLEYPAHDPVFGLLLPFSKRAELDTEWTETRCTDTDASSSLHSAWISTCDCTRPEQLPTSSIVCRKRWNSKNTYSSTSQGFIP